MQKSDINQKVMTAHRRVQPSTTLNRKYVKRPVKGGDIVTSVKKSPKIQHFNTPTTNVTRTQSQKRVETTRQIEPAKMHPLQVTTNTRMKQRTEQSQNTVAKLSAKEIKEQAIQKALNTAMVTNQEEKSYNQKPHLHFGLGRIMLALGCAAVVVFAIVYFVNLNMPDISLKVAAIQTGIDASYPSYVPRGYNISSITSEEGKVTLTFKNNDDEKTFTLHEEKSSWDSNALLTNYVKNSFGEDYSTIREQGLTIYVNESDAVWVNGGVLYIIKATTDTLTNKQIRSIATSL